MRSLELNKAYYWDCISGLLISGCPHVAAGHAAALIGRGSEVLGYDDELSTRYGWGPRLVLFLTEEDYQEWCPRVIAVLQEGVPTTFLGHPTRYTQDGPPQPTTDRRAPLGITVTTCGCFGEVFLGIPATKVAAPALPSKEWLLISEEGLLRLTAGEVYYDNTGDLTALRARFAYFPDDVWRYRLAYQWTALSWDIDLIGICARRGDILSARVAVARSVERIIGLIFLLNRTYRPGYLKWLHRTFTALPWLAADLMPAMEQAMTCVNPSDAVVTLYPVLDRLVLFQSDRAGIPIPDYRKPPSLDPGFFARDLPAVVQSVRTTIGGELAMQATTVGALDQWVMDQDLLMVPRQLRLLAGVYNAPDPYEELLGRDKTSSTG